MDRGATLADGTVMVNGTWKKDTVVEVRMDMRGGQGSGEVDGVCGWGAIAARSSRTASSAASRWACDRGRGGGDSIRAEATSTGIHATTFVPQRAPGFVWVRSKARRRGEGVKGCAMASVEKGGK